MAALSAERYLAHEGLIREFHQAPDAAEPMVAVATPAAAEAAVRYQLYYIDRGGGRDTWSSVDIE